MVYFIDITKVRGFVLLLSSSSLVELGVPNIFQTVGSNRIGAWRLVSNGESLNSWEVHYIEQTSQGVSVSFGELNSDLEAAQSRKLLQDAGLIDDVGHPMFSGTGGELIELLKPICQKLDAEATLRRLSSNNNPNGLSKLFERFQRFIFGIENEGWGLVVLYIPREKQGIKIRKGSDIPYIFTESRPVL